MSTGMLVLTQKALTKADFLKAHLPDKNSIVIYAPKKLKISDHDLRGIHYYEEKFSQIVSQIYQRHERLIFIMAMGIVVRSIAPLLRDKTMDPAIVVMDENLDFVISLVGGHIAGANELANLIASCIGCTAVITTATDVNHTSALDIIVRDLNIYENHRRELYKSINYDLAQGERVFLMLDEYVRREQIDLRGFSCILGTESEAFFYPKNSEKDQKDGRKIPLIHIGITKSKEKYWFEENSSIRYEKIIPKKLVLGMGCKKDTIYKVVWQVFDEFMKIHGFEEASVKEIVSIDIKKEEQALITLADRLKANFRTYSAEQINDCMEHVEIFSQSEFVKRITGAPAVAQPCAYMASNGNLITARYAKNGVTIAAGYQLMKG